MILEPRLETTAKSVTAARTTCWDRGHWQRYRLAMERAENSTPNGRFDCILMVTRRTASSLAEE